MIRAIREIRGQERFRRLEARGACGPEAPHHFWTQESAPQFVLICLK